MNGRIKRPGAEESRLPFPVVGKIKVGKKAISKNGKEYPVSTDYFLPNGKYAALFTKAYGEKPNTIQIVFPEDDARKVCNEYYEYRDTRGQLVATGDGEVFKVWNGKEYAPYSTDKYPDIMDRVAQKYQSLTGWRVRLTLTFILPLVRGIAGCWQFETNGNASSIPNIRDTFDMMQAERGSCKGVIFDLVVKFAQSQKPGENSRYPVVSLIPNESEENIKLVLEAKKPVKVLEHKE